MAYLARDASSPRCLMQDKLNALRICQEGLTAVDAGLVETTIQALASEYDSLSSPTNQPREWSEALYTFQIYTSLLRVSGDLAECLTSFTNPNDFVHPTTGMARLARAAMGQWTISLHELSLRVLEMAGFPLPAPLCNIFARSEPSGRTLRDLRNSLAHNYALEGLIEQEGYYDPVAHISWLIVNLPCLQFVLRAFWENITLALRLSVAYEIAHWDKEYRDSQQKHETYLQEAFLDLGSAAKGKGKASGSCDFNRGEHSNDDATSTSSGPGSSNAQLTPAWCGKKITWDDNDVPTLHDARSAGNMDSDASSMDSQNLGGMCLDLPTSRDSSSRGCEFSAATKSEDPDIKRCLKRKRDYHQN